VFFISALDTSRCSFSRLRHSVHFAYQAPRGAVVGHAIREAGSDRNFITGLLCLGARGSALGVRRLVGEGFLS